LTGRKAKLAAVLMVDFGLYYEGADGQQGTAVPTWTGDGMKRIALSLVGVTAVAAMCVAGPGRGVVLEMPVSGTVAVTNVQANSVWRPTVVAVQCSDVASRTVAVSPACTGLVEIVRE
jgi:hypothetical protein